MNRALLVLCLSLLIALAGGQTMPSRFTHYEREHLQARQAELERKVEGAKPSFSVLARYDHTVSAIIHRAVTGEAELHDTMADYFIVRSGRGSLVVGGVMQSPRQVGPGEFAAASIAGGTTHPLLPGDVVFIPAKQPHHVLVDKGASLTYMIIKVKE